MSHGSLRPPDQPSMQCWEALSSRTGTTYGLSGVRNATRMFHVVTDSPTQDPTDVVNAGRGKTVYTRTDVTGYLATDDPVFAPLSSAHPWYSWLTVIDHRIVAIQTPRKYHVEAVYGIPELITLPGRFSRPRWNISGRAAGEALRIVREIYPGSDNVAGRSESDWLNLEPTGSDTGGPRVIGPRQFSLADDDTSADKKFYAKFKDKKGVDVTVELVDTGARVEEGRNDDQPLFAITFKRTQPLEHFTLFRLSPFIGSVNTANFSVLSIDGTNWTFGPAGHVRMVSFDFTPVQNDTTVSGQRMLYQITLMLAVSWQPFTPVKEVQRYTSPEHKGVAAVFGKNEDGNTVAVVDKMRYKRLASFQDMFSILG